MTREKKKRGFSEIIAALILIIIPGINIIDITPDFIAYFIILAALSRAKDIAPYFAEAALAFKRLAVLSLLKIPALIIVYIVRGKNFQDHDITVLMTLVFTVAEVILLVVAVPTFPATVDNDLCQLHIGFLFRQFDLMGSVTVCRA